MKKKTNLKKVTVNQTPANPVELMMGWYDLFHVLYFITAAVGTIVTFVGHRGIIATAFCASFGVALIWFPGMLLTVLLPEAMYYIARTSGVYASARSVFADGIVTAFFRCTSVPIGAGGMSVFFALLLSVTVLIGDICALFNEDAWILAIVAGAILSLGGALVIGTRLVLDFYQEHKLARQLL